MSEGLFMSVPAPLALALHQALPPNLALNDCGPHSNTLVSSIDCLLHILSHSACHPPTQGSHTYTTSAILKCCVV